MTSAELRKAIGLVDWAALRGAYGASGEGSEHGNVPQALATLATERDGESDDWQDAMNVLLSHVWHQGDVYEVTPAVVPFVFDLIELPRVANRRELAAFLALLAESVSRYEASDDDARRNLAREIDAMLARRSAAVVAWLDGKLAEPAAFLGARSRALRQPVLDALSRKAPLPFFVFVALASQADAPAWARERAEAALASDDSLTRLAAAAFLARAGNASETVLRRIEGILTRDAHAKLTAAIGIPFELTIPEVRLPFDGALIDGTVVFRGPKIVLARLVDGKDVTLHWADAPVSKGMAVRVGLSAQREPRVVELVTEGTARRIELAPPPSSDRLI